MSKLVKMMRSDLSYFNTLARNRQLTNDEMTAVKAIMVVLSANRKGCEVK